MYGINNIVGANVGTYILNKQENSLISIVLYASLTTLLVNSVDSAKETRLLPQTSGKGFKAMKNE